MPKTTREYTKVLIVRVTPQQDKAIRAAAKKARVEVSEWVRTKLLGRR